jgi:two-component system chemotaxis response regulator CheY
MNQPIPEFGTLRVLIVDENRTFQNLLRSMLRGFGIRRVDVLWDPDRVMHLLEGQIVDLAFIDLVVPQDTGAYRKTGMELIAEIRHSARLANPYMAAILVTGHSSRPVVEAAVSVGADHVLAKPVSPNAVHAAVRAFAARRPSYVSGPSGYFGPDKEAARRRLRGMGGARQPPIIERARRPAAPGPKGPIVAPTIPGLNVPIRLAPDRVPVDATFLD